MAATDDLHHLATLAHTHHWRIVAVGDPHQLPAVGRGGVFAHWIDTLPHHRLDTPRRFTEAWEAAASLALRAGDPEAADLYDQHRRLDTIHPALLPERVAIQHRAHTDRGRTVAITTSTADTARRINQAIQSDRSRGHWRRPTTSCSPTGPGSGSATGSPPATTTPTSGPTPANESGTATPGTSPTSTPTATSPPPTTPEAPSDSPAATCPGTSSSAGPSPATAPKATPSTSASPCSKPAPPATAPTSPSPEAATRTPPSSSTPPASPTPETPSPTILTRTPARSSALAILHRLRPGTELTAPVRGLRGHEQATEPHPLGVTPGDPTAGARDRETQDKVDKIQARLDRLQEPRRRDGRGIDLGR